MKELDERHLYMTWNHKEDGCSDLMYKIKNAIDMNGTCHIPIYDNLSEQEIKQIDSQNKNSIETYLYMTNFKTLHVFNLIKIESSSNNIFLTSEKTIEHFLYNPSRQWAVVKDYYVIAIKDDDVHDELSHLSIGGGINDKITPYKLIPKMPIFVKRDNNKLKYFQNIYSSISHMNDGEIIFEPAQITTWSKCFRSITSEYYLCERYLKKYRYGEDAWNNQIPYSVGHFLIHSEQKRIQAAGSDNIHELGVLHEAFQACYRPIKFQHF